MTTLYEGWTETAEQIAARKRRILAQPMNTMTDTQRKGMIDFHTRAEKAYRAAGKIQHAEAARARREQLAEVMHDETTHRTTIF